MERVGLESVRNVVEKTRYPASKSTLMKKVGWKLIQLDRQRQVKLETILADLPPETYKSADELVQKIKSVKECAD